MRKRHVVVAATGLVAAAALAGCSGGAQTPQAGSTPGANDGSVQSTKPTAKPPSGDPPVLVKPTKSKSPEGKPTHVGALTLRLPKGWHVHSGPGKDSAYVTTGGCDSASLRCPGFRVMGAAQIKNGHEGKPYKTGSPFYPATDAQPCPANPKYVQKLPGRPKSSGYGNVGDRKAVYYQWTISCVTKGKKPKVKSIFYQWEWYLPQSKLLIVDQWSTSTLGRILKDAKFR